MSCDRLTCERFFKKLRTGRWGDEEFAKLLEEHGDEVVFRTLMVPFTGSFPERALLGLQQEAGRQLCATNPKCPAAADELLREILPQWSVSAPELVIYMAKQFGVDTLLEAINRLEGEGNTTELARRKLRACRFFAENCRPR